MQNIKNLQNAKWTNKNSIFQWDFDFRFDISKNGFIKNNEKIDLNSCPMPRYFMYRLSLNRGLKK